MTKMLLFASGHSLGLVNEFGHFGALLAFFLIVPLGHTLIGVVFVLIGLAYPKVASGGKNQKMKAGAEGVKVEFEGNNRTILMGIGACIIVASFVEGAVT